MIRLTAADIQAIVACDRLSPRERAIVTMRYQGRLRTNVIGTRLGITQSAVTGYLTMARRKALAQAANKPVKRGTGNVKLYPIDADWERRQIAYLRTLDDDDHRQRYLRGIAICHGQAMAERIEGRA